MKSTTVRIASTLTLVAVLLMSVLVGSAQQRPIQQQEQEKVIPELNTQLEVGERRVLVPRECAGIKPVIQIHDVADNFNPLGNPVSLSPALTSFLSANNLSPKGYDDGRVNKVFADSFKLGNCKVCYATLEVRVKHTSDLWLNDTLTAGVAPFVPASLRLLGTTIWQANDPAIKTGTYVLPASALSQLVFNNQAFDVVAQDDSDFDYMKLTVWYY